MFELLIVLVFMGHLTGCFFYMFGGSVYWRTQGARQECTDSWRMGEGGKGGNRR